MIAQEHERATNERMRQFVKKSAAQEAPGATISTSPIPQHPLKTADSVVDGRQLMAQEQQ
jgi:hypothetical protein